MGAAASRAVGAEVEDGGTGLGDLPESCAAEVMMNLDPAEICRMAGLSRVFRGAAGADCVWEVKLPVNYRQLVRRRAAEGGKDSLLLRRSKKEVYARLCRPNPFDGGTKEFWLEKSKGGVCVSISSKALAITGIGDRRHWNYIATEESRFLTVAYLQQIWWLEVGGEIEFHFPAGTYSLFFRLHLGCPSKRLGRQVWSTQHIHGWDKKPVQFQLSTSDDQHALSLYLLDKPGSWIHYHVGDFVVKNSSVPTTVKFSMKQIDCTHTKGGLSVDSVLIYPKGFRHEKPV